MKNFNLKKDILKERIPHAEIKMITKAYLSSNIFEISWLTRLFFFLKF